MVATSPVGNQPSRKGSPPAPLKYSLSIQGPRTRRSPKALPSRGSSLPSLSTIFISTPKMVRPCLHSISRRFSAERRSCLALSVQKLPSGLISFMPQACLQSTPKSSRKLAILAGGQAEPPTTTDFSVLHLRLFCFIWASSASHTVGTPALAVTFSASNSSYRLFPSRPAPGKTSFAPFSGAKSGTPQALTWNMGTTGRITERAEQLNTSGKEAAKACRIVERLAKSTPFGLPVVPEV